MKRMAWVLTAAALGLMPVGGCQTNPGSSVSREDEMIQNEGVQAREGVSSDSDISDEGQTGNFIEPGSLGADE